MSTIKVLLVRLDGLVCTFNVEGDHMAACRKTAEELGGLWAQQAPVARVFFAKPGRLEEMDVDLLRTVRS